MATKKSNNFQAKSKSSSGSLTPWLGIAAIVILLDQITKITIEKSFQYAELYPVTSFFNLTLAYKKLFCWSLALIMGGAIGNVIDRVMYGHVIDFLDFHYKEVYHFAAFNVADSAICLGAALFILDELRRVKK